MSRPSPPPTFLWAVLLLPPPLLRVVLPLSPCHHPFSPLGCLAPIHPSLLFSGAISPPSSGAVFFPFPCHHPFSPQGCVDPFPLPSSGAFLPLSRLQGHLAPLPPYLISSGPSFPLSLFHPPLSPLGCLASLRPLPFSFLPHPLPLLWGSLTPLCPHPFSPPGRLISPPPFSPLGRSHPSLPTSLLSSGPSCFSPPLLYSRAHLPFSLPGHLSPLHPWTDIGTRRRDNNWSTSHPH